MLFAYVYICCMELNQEVKDYLAALEVPPVPEWREEDYLEFVTGNGRYKNPHYKFKPWKRAVKQWLLTEYGEVSLPEDLRDPLM